MGPRMEPRVSLTHTKFKTFTYVKRPPRWRLARAVARGVARGCPLGLLFINIFKISWPEDVAKGVVLPFSHFWPTSWPNKYL